MKYTFKHYLLGDGKGYPNLPNFVDMASGGGIPSTQSSTP